MEIDLKKIKTEAESEIFKAKDLKELDRVYKKYIGKKGKIAQVFASLGGLSDKKKKELGEAANSAKQEVMSLAKEKMKALKLKARDEKIKGEKIDITRPGQKLETGHLHPLTIAQRQAEQVFLSMGFEIVSGPEVETEWYNFDALNIPKNHPARDLWDTFWLKPESSKLLLRTHTSPVQIRYMEKHQPPLKIVAPGRVFRRDAVDATHEPQFYQLEGLMVDETVSVANFKAIITEFLTRFFKVEVEIRLRPSFFPFVEPGFEIDVKRGKMDWLEIMGAGMAHPNVLKNCGLNPNNWQGFAFGVGLERLAMIKYKIKDIRLFYQNDLRFLKQF